MKNYCLLTLALFFTSFINAQSMEHSINVSVGYGLSAPYEEIEVYSTGLYFQGEYVFSASTWFDYVLYAGGIFTKKSEIADSLVYAKSNANAALLGGKVRVKIPIPWVSPYVEGGLGTSIGHFETSISREVIEKNGFVFHIPFSLGLELGPSHNVDVEFTYYFHPAAKQFVGAAAIGLRIPLKKKVG